MEKYYRNYTLIAVVLIVSQFVDLFPVADHPFWYLYAVNAFVDYVAFLIVLCLVSLVRGPILLLLCASMVAHFLGLITEYLYFSSSIHAVEVITKAINGLYSATLLVILALKMWVMVSGYGRLSRKRRGNLRGSDHWRNAVYDSFNSARDKE